MSISLNEILKQVEEYKRFAKEPREQYMYNNIITLLEELQIRRAFDAGVVIVKKKLMKC